jgi:hypothetical protein
VSYLRLLTIAAVICPAVGGCGDDDGAGHDGGLGTGDAAPAPDAGIGPAQPLALFVFDQGLDAIFRLEDLDGDGDMHDAGEAVRFFDSTVPDTGTGNSAGLFPLGPRSLLATDDLSTVEPRDDNVVYLHDDDADGDCREAGESSVWFDGALPGGFHLTQPIALARGAAGELYLADSNAADAANPFGIYRLHDDNADLDVDDTGEHALFFELDTPDDQSRRTDDIEVDADGKVWLWDVATPGEETLYAIDPDAPALHEELTRAALERARGLVLLGELSHLGRLRPSGELVFQAYHADSGFGALLAVQDSNGDGAIDPSAEVRVLWDESLHFAEPSNSGARDLATAADGSILMLVANQGTIHRMRDENGDGDLDDAGEDEVVYDTAQSVASGGENTANLLSIAATLAGS